MASFSINLMEDGLMDPLNLGIIAALLIALAGIVIGLRKASPKELLVFLLFGIPTILGVCVFILIGGAIGGGLSLLTNLAIQDIFLSSLVGSLAAAAAFHTFHQLVFHRLMKIPPVPFSQYVGGPLSYAAGTLIGVNLAFAFILDPQWRNIASVVLAGGLPPLFIIVIEKLGLYTLPRIKKDNR
ncbi:MAG: hypothetical protein KC777_05020 [Cyanobacteria bacterium HKST-UBA02]|nr:hypothetical protein [Cyanobacteria bacterium HKST-UBA02]